MWHGWAIHLILVSEVLFSLEDEDWGTRRMAVAALVTTANDGDARVINPVSHE